MNVRDLRKVLEDLSRILSASNARPASRDVASLGELLERHDGEPAEQFLQHLEGRLNEPPVTRYSRLLREAGSNKSAFDAVFSMLTSDKEISKTDAAEIAFLYIGYSEGRSSWPNKKAALQAIQDWFKHIAYESVKAGRVEKARYAG